MSLAQGNNTPTRPRIEPGSPDPESDALTTRPVRPLVKLIRQLYKLGNGFGKFKKDTCSNHMILYISVQKSYFQISDFYTYCSVIYVIYNHNIINMYVLSYHLSIKIIFGVSITI